MILFFFLTSAIASDLKVMTQLKEFDLKFNSNLIDFKSRDLNIIFKTRPCNKKIFINFQSEINAILKKKALRIGRSEENLNFNFEGKTYNDPYSAVRAQALMNIPDELKRLQKEELKLCPQK